MTEEFRLTPFVTPSLTTAVARTLQELEDKGVNLDELKDVPKIPVRKKFNQGALNELVDLKSKGNAIQTVANSFSVLGTALDGISSDSLDKLADSMEILSDAEVTITPSVQVANLANMMIPQAMVTGGAIAAAAGAGVTSGGSGLMITNVSNITNQNNQVKNRNIRATGSMRSDSNFSQVH